MTGVHDTIMRLGVRVGRHQQISNNRRYSAPNFVSSENVPINETFQGRTVWDGVVEVFDPIGHPTASKLYAWSHATDDPTNPWRHVTVLHGHPITSPLLAVRAAIIQEFIGNAPVEG